MTALPFGMRCGIGTALWVKKATDLLQMPRKCPAPNFFPDARLCFAENMLANADDRPAISAYGEDGRHLTLSRRELKSRVMALAGWMREQGIGPGDRVAAFVPNSPESIITMLAASALGAVFPAARRTLASAVLETVLVRLNQSCCLLAMAIAMPASQWTDRASLPNLPPACPPSPLS